MKAAKEQKSEVKESAAKPKKTAKSKATKEVEPVDEAMEDAADEAEAAEEEADEIADQTAALLKGFESDEDDDMADVGFKEGQEVPVIDKKLTKKAKKAAQKTDPSKPGVVYVGRIPHGFYEHEMKAYFSQFGPISKLRLSRNRQTGASRHFAFMEFESAEVAEIVAKTMDNYLLFGHILKCKYVPTEQVHEEMWKGANKRFKKVPWNKLEGRKLEQGMDEAAWTKRIEAEETRRAEKAEKLKAIGYEFKAPKIKSAKDVPKSKRQPTVKAVQETMIVEEPKAVEAAPIVEEEAPKEPAKKSNKRKAAETKEIVAETAKPAKKGKKSKAEKVEKVEEPKIEELLVEAEEKPVKSTKSKKAKEAKPEKTEATEPKRSTRKRKSIN